MYRRYIQRGKKLLSLFFLCAVHTACSFQNPFISEPIVLHDQPRTSYSVLLVYGNGASVQDGQRVFSQVKRAVAKQANIELQQWNAVSISHRFYERNLTSFMSSWKDEISNFGNYDIVYLFLPTGERIPSLRENVQGYAQGVGLVGKVPNAFAMSMLTGNEGVDAWSMMHEVGHLLGAEHASRGVMRDDHSPESLAFSSDSLVAIAGKTRALYASLRKKRIAFKSFHSPKQ